MHVAVQTIYQIILCITLICSAVLAIEIDLPQLPADEDEAQRMLGEGTLDSSVWRKVEPFYTMPIRVLLGDLHILQDLFSELPVDLPSMPAALARYRPWNDSTQAFFFSDFPGLIPFRPILSFEDNPSVAVPAQAAFYFSKRGSGDAVRQYALFSAGDPAVVAAGGRVDFTDAYGRWYRRTVTIVPERGLRVTAGNFSPGRRDRFFTGYFPSRSGADTAVTENWLYGTSRTWNGVIAGFSPGHGASAEGFFHSGRTERMEQLSGSMNASELFSYYGGVSYLTTMNSTGTSEDYSSYSYISAGIEASPGRAWKCELQSGIDLRRPQAVPWYFAWSHDDGCSGFKGALTGLPPGFYAPRSETGRLLLSRSGMTGDTVKKYLLNADVSFSRRQSGFFNCTPRMSCIIAGNRVRYLLTSVELSGKTRLDYRIWYSWAPLFRSGEASLDAQLDAQLFAQQGSLELSLPLSKNISFSCRNNAVFISGGYWSDRLRVSPCFRTGRGVLELSPLFIMYGTGFGQWEKIIGLEQRLLLYRKTFSDMTFEQQLPFSSWETIRARGRMSFLF